MYGGGSGYVVNTSGYVVNTSGYVFNTSGYVVNTSGYVVNTSGYVVNTSGYVVNTSTSRIVTLFPVNKLHCRISGAFNLLSIIRLHFKNLLWTCVSVFVYECVCTYVCVCIKYVY